MSIYVVILKSRGDNYAPLDKELWQHSKQKQHDIAKQCTFITDKKMIQFNAKYNNQKTALASDSGHLITKYCW